MRDVAGGRAWVSASDARVRARVAVEDALDDLIVRGRSDHELQQRVAASCINVLHVGLTALVCLVHMRGQQH